MHATDSRFLSSTSAMRLPAAPSHSVIRTESMAGSHEPFVAGAVDPVGGGDDAVAASADEVGTGPVDGEPPTPGFGVCCRLKRAPATTIATTTSVAPASVPAGSPPVASRR